MKWFRNRTRPRKDRKDRPAPAPLRRARPAVEQLEDRTLLSASTLAVSSLIAQGTENLQNFVTQEYNALLHRAPDATSLSGWTGALQHNLSFEQLEARLASSAEYLAAHGGSAGAAWVQGLYHDFLNRTPSQSEVNGWLNALASGVTPYQAALGMATSAERDAIVVTNDFQQILGHAPDAAGLAAWQGALQHGLSQEGLIADLLASDEFYQKSGNTDPGFIAGVYQALFGRTPSASDVSGWVNFMNQSGATRLLSINLNPIDLNLLGLEVQTSQIQVNVSALPGQGRLLGNLLSDVANLLNLQGVNTALNNVLGSVVGLLNSSSLAVSGATTNSGPLSSAQAATVPVLDLFVAPVHLNLLGALVDTSPIHVTITAHSGQGLILGNVVADLANLFNPPLPSKLDLDTLNAKLQQLLSELNQQIPGIAPAPTTTPTAPAGQEQVLALTVPPINLNLLGLILQTNQIQVNANAQTGNGDLLGNVLTTLLNTLGATPQNLQALNNNLNALLAKVVGVLNASSLTLPANALNTLSQVLQELALPNLINASGTASAPILNLTIASPDGSGPPVNVNLLGLVITTSNIQAQLLAQTGQGQVLGNLLYNVANLLNPGGSLNLLTILNLLAL